MIDSKNIFVIEKQWNYDQRKYILKKVCMTALHRSYIWSDAVFTFQKITYNQNPVPENSKIIFTKNALFPKFKLETTSFKRSIKSSTADCIVCGELEQIKIPSSYLYLQSGEQIFFVYRPDICQILNMQVEDDNVIIRYLVNNKYISDKYTILSNDNIFAYVNPKSKEVNLNLLEDPKFKDKIYLDTNFNNQISKQANSLTDENFTMIRDLLASRDISSQELGLKTLCTFNWAECPLKITSLLVKFERSLKMTNAWKSVAVKTLLKNINFPTSSYYYYNDFINNLLYKSTKSDFTLTPIDKEYMQKEIYSYIEDNIIKNFNSQSFFNHLDKFGIKFSYNLCIEDKQNNTQ